MEASAETTLLGNGEGTEHVREACGEGGFDPRSSHRQSS